MANGSIRNMLLDLSKSRPFGPSTVTIARGDDGGMTLVADIFDCGGVMSLDGTTVTLEILMSDGSSASLPCDVSGQRVTCRFGEGKVTTDHATAYFIIKRGSVTCSTARFRIVALRGNEA